MRANKAAEPTGTMFIEYQNSKTEIKVNHQQNESQQVMMFFSPFFENTKFSRVCKRGNQGTKQSTNVQTSNDTHVRICMCTSSKHAQITTKEENSSDDS